jgi:two-component system CheB/CheR fusion protein
VRKTIRDIVVFANQDVLRDPPFSKIDLISCRNLLIYMGAELQKKLLPLLHYALNQDGYLFLGSSETIGEFLEHFAVVDKKWKLYQRKGVMDPRVAIAPFTPPRVEMWRLAGRSSRASERPGLASAIWLKRLCWTMPRRASSSTPSTKCSTFMVTGRYLEAAGEGSLNLLAWRARG